MHEPDKKVIQENYAKLASTMCCGQDCTSSINKIIEAVSLKAGYRKNELFSIPQGANLGLGCGNPVAFAEMKEGDVVLDLGSGGGFDCFLAANKVGKNGRVIGIDMTQEMIERAKENALKGQFENVAFRLGEIENMPVESGSIDVAISNCVINLSQNKKRVFEEVFRVLKPGGRLVISDIVLVQPLSKELSENVKAYIACISGAEIKDKYLQEIKEAGFKEVKIMDENRFQVAHLLSDSSVQALIGIFGFQIEKIQEKAQELQDSVISIKVSAIK